MKRIVWPLLHRYELNSKLNIKKNPWGWISQEDIIKLSKNKIPKTNASSFSFNDWEDRSIIDNLEFKKGVKLGYKCIINSFYKKDNFLENCYLTPKLSIAVNDINDIILEQNIKYEKPELKFKEIKNLGSWVEIGISKSNSKILGFWDKEFIKKEIITGGIGPEIKYLWDQLPLKQKVRVLYKLQNRIDIFEWERCLIEEDYEWKVSNINNIIV